MSEQEAGSGRGCSLLLQQKRRRSRLRVHELSRRPSQRHLFCAPDGQTGVPLRLLPGAAGRHQQSKRASLFTAVTLPSPPEQDGFNDLAVGAPYEEPGGALYVFLGSKQGLKTAPVQVIRASDLPQRSPITRTFGYSLAGSLDIDGNGYPDLLIGSYEDDAVVLLRGRPIVNIVTMVRGQLQNIDPTRTHCDAIPGVKLVCFQVEPCFRFNSPLSLGVVKLAYKIEAETFSGKKYYRVKFNSSADNDRPNVVSKDIVIRPDDMKQEYCSKEVVFLKDKSDIQNPVKFKLTYSLVPSEPLPVANGRHLPDINKMPILNQEEAQKIFEARFLKDCGQCSCVCPFCRLFCSFCCSALFLPLLSLALF